MTRDNIEKLNSIDEAIELINLLSYEECLLILNKVSSLPQKLFDATIERARSLRGVHSIP